MLLQMLGVAYEKVVTSEDESMSPTDLPEGFCYKLSCALLKKTRETAL